jgi:3alpha(or 20beta)-hydroxysteroid dehydrogenase
VGSLDGKVAIITGAASGQGRAEARLFAEQGASVVVSDLSAVGAEVADEIGGDALFVQHDVSDEAAWANAVDRTIARYGRIDVLVNNAGVYQPRTFQDTSVELMDLHYRINQLGVFLGMKAVAGHMAGSGGGSIINIASGAALRGMPSMFAYSGSKWAVRGLSRCAAIDLAPDGVRVNSIYPGLIDTPMLGENSPENLEAMRNMIPVKRLGAPEEVAAAALFLASDAASYVSGAEISVCGAINA